jgi:hypothetical protein
MGTKAIEVVGKLVGPIGYICLENISQACKNKDAPLSFISDGFISFFLV